MMTLHNNGKYWLDFLFIMTKKEIKVRYKHATLGFLWAIINPLTQMFIMGFVFQYFVPVKVDNYFLFLFAGLLPWNFFSQSLLKSTSAFFYERELIKKSKFPRETIVLSIVMSNLFHFLIALIILIIMLIGDKLILENYNIAQMLLYVNRMLWIIPAIFLLTIFTSSISLLTSSLNVRYRDVNFFVQLIVTMWFYATPIIYSLSLLPKNLQPFFYLNPMTFISELFQYALINQKILYQELTYISLITCILIIYFGIRVFLKESKNFDDWL